MLEPFTERLGNPVTPGPGNAKELRETKPKSTEQDWIIDQTTEEWAATLEAATQYTNLKQKTKQLPANCVDGLWDLIGLYLTPGDITPQEFVDCITAALVKELEHQQHQMKTIENTLALISGLDHD